MFELFLLAYFLQIIFESNLYLMLIVKQGA